MQGHARRRLHGVSRQARLTPLFVPAGAVDEQCAQGSPPRPHTGHKCPQLKLELPKGGSRL
eukprot:1669948-Amphidinium_carterae.1